MPIGCDDVGARMLELLYGELPEAERAALEAHLDRDGGGCERCRRELADLQGARAQARQVLDEAPPARARAAILRVAEAAAAARARLAPTVTPVARTGSWWERHRSRWTFPTLATIGAVAVFLLANKIFLEPEKTYERGRQGLVPAAAPAPAVEAPGTNEPAPSAAAEALRPAKPSAMPAGGGPTPRGGLGASESIKGAGTGADDLPMRDALPAHRRMTPPRWQDQTAKLESAGKEESAAIHPVRRAERAAKADVEDNPLDESFAPPPPPRMAEPAPPAPRAPARKSVSDSVDLERLMNDRGSGGGGVPASPAPTGARTKAAPSRARMEESSAASAAPPANAPKAKRPAEEEAEEAAVDDGDAAPAFKRGHQDGPAVAQADRLFSTGRWVEAASAYRELLQRDPRNPDAPRWRKRLAAAQAAVDR